MQQKFFYFFKTDLAGYHRRPRNIEPPDCVSLREGKAMILKQFGFLSALLLAGCTIDVQTGPTQYESKAIEMDQAELVRATLQMAGGELKIGSGTEKLMQAYFTYNVPSWKPEVSYVKESGSSELSVSQPSSHGGLHGNRKYEWDLRFNEKTPLDLTVHFGAGQAQLDLSRLNLRAVTVHMGVGQLDMDLRGQPKTSYNVEVHGGIGQATVRLPSGVGIEAEAQGGIGHIDMRGLRHEGDRWVNDDLGHAPVTIKVQVHGGIGEIRVLADRD